VFFRSESKQESFWVSDGAWISVLTATVSHKVWPPERNLTLVNRKRTNTSLFRNRCTEAGASMADC